MPSALGHSQWGPSRLEDLPICPQCTLASSESPAAPPAQASEDGAAALTWRHPPLGVGPSCPTGHRRLSPNGLEKSLALNAAGTATGVREVTVLPLDLSSYPVSRGGHHPPSRSCDAPVTFSPIIWFIPHIWEPSPLDCFTEGHRGSKKPGACPGQDWTPLLLGPALHAATLGWREGQEREAGRVRREPALGRQVHLGPDSACGIFLAAPPSAGVPARQTSSHLGLFTLTTGSRAPGRLAALVGRPLPLPARPRSVSPRGCQDPPFLSLELAPSAFFPASWQPSLGVLSLPDPPPGPGAPDTCTVHGDPGLPRHKAATGV